MPYQHIHKYKLARIIIEGGADINWNVNGVTPIMEACLLPNNNELKYQLILLLLLQSWTHSTALCLHGSCQKKVIELLQEQRQRKA